MERALTQKRAMERMMIQTAERILTHLRTIERRLTPVEGSSKGAGIEGEVGGGSGGDEADSCLRSIGNVLVVVVVFVMVKVDTRECLGGVEMLSLASDQAILWPTTCCFPAPISFRIQALNL